jgi:lysophospholipase L1-like esterase
MRRVLHVARQALITVVVTVALVVGGDVGAAFAVASFAGVPAQAAGSGSHETAPTLVVFGDSLGQGFRATPGHGWIDLLRDRLVLRDARVAVRNESVGGSRVIDLRRQVARGPAHGLARAVLVVAGGNDLMHGTDPYSLARADVALMGDIHRSYPHARVIVTNIPDVSWRSFRLKNSGPPEPLPAPFRLGLGWLTNVENTIVDRIAVRSGADILDIHRLTLEGDAETPGLKKISLQEFAQRYVASDGLHPNDRGYALLADFAWPHVARAMRASGPTGT